MSFKALAWAAEQKCGSPTAKAVLIALASYADEHGTCWPLQDQIAEKAEISREAVSRNMRILEGKNLLSRQGRKYHLRLSNVIEDHKANVTQDHNNVILDHNSVVNSPLSNVIEDHSNVIENHSSVIGDHSVLNQSKNQSKNQSNDTAHTKAQRHRQVSRGTPERPPEVSDATWSDFLQLRTAKRAPLTETAMDGIRREAANAGWSLQRALDECCARGWQGFKADWVKSGGSNGKQQRTDGNRNSPADAVQNLFAGFARAKMPDDVSEF